MSDFSAAAQKADSLVAKKYANIETCTKIMRSEIGSSVALTSWAESG